MNYIDHIFKKVVLGSICILMLTLYFLIDKSNRIEIELLNKRIQFNRDTMNLNIKIRNINNKIDFLDSNVNLIPTKKSIKLYNTLVEEKIDIDNDINHIESQSIMVSHIKDRKRVTTYYFIVNIVFLIIFCIIYIFEYAKR